MDEDAPIPDGTAPLVEYVRRAALFFAAIEQPPPADGVARARREKRGERRRYLALCRLLRQPVGTRVSFRVFSDGVVSDAQGHVRLRVDRDHEAVRVAAGDRAWLVVLPPGALGGADFDVWGYLRRELRRAVAEEHA
jgi:hypothetical protein